MLVQVYEAVVQLTRAIKAYVRQLEEDLSAQHGDNPQATFSMQQLQYVAPERVPWLKLIVDHVSKVAIGFML